MCSFWLLLVYYLGWVGWGGKEGRWVRIIFVKIWGNSERKEKTTNNDWVLCPEYRILSKNVIGNLNEDCERLFKSSECLKLRSQGIPCLSLMLFPKKRLRSYQKDTCITMLSSFSRSVVSDSLRPHESQHARPPCPSPSPGVHSDSCPSSQ